MSRLQREWEIKLSMLGSIARSQEALAKLLGSIADSASDMVGADLSPDVLKEHVRVMTGMQRALLRTVAGRSWHPPKRGKRPASPWLSEKLQMTRRYCVREVPCIETKVEEERQCE